MPKKPKVFTTYDSFQNHYFPASSSGKRGEEEISSVLVGQLAATNALKKCIKTVKSKK